MDKNKKKKLMNGSSLAFHCDILLQSKGKNNLHKEEGII